MQRDLPMQRRDLLLTAAAATVAGVAAPAAATAAKPSARVRTRDGVGLFHRDWGSGKPVLFVHAWALPSAMWTYQMAELGPQGCAASPSTGAGMAARTFPTAAMTWIGWPTIWPR